MTLSKSYTARLVVLALLLAFGPLQATAAFACEMMETVVHEVCCCDDEAPASRAKGAADQDCDDEMISAAPCCEHSTTVGVNADSLKSTPGSKSGSKDSPSPFDVDPPDAGLVDMLAGPAELPPLTPEVRSFIEPVYPGDGSTLWLTTRRLRI